MRRLPALALLIALAGLPACGSSDEPAESDEPAGSASTPSATASTPADPSPSRSAEEQPTATTPAETPTDAAGPVEVEPTGAAASSDYVADCRPPAGVARRLERLGTERAFVANGSGSRLAVTTVGTGPTTVVLLHQVEGGACGWADFIAAAGGDGRFRFVAPDLCGSGASDCKGQFTLDDIAQTKLVLDWVRKTHRPERVTALGASMGGAIVVRAAGLGLPLDAGVDVSGPDGWFDGADIAADIRRSSIPLLLAYDPSDDPGTAQVARKEASRAGDAVEYLALTGGHGWSNLTDGAHALTPAARKMLDFLA